MKVQLKKIQWTKQKKILTAISSLLVVIIIIVVVAVNSGSKEEYVYKETKVEFGNLVVGITESGTVDIGTVEQTFDLDMSALQRVETSDSSSGNTGNNGGNAFGGAMGGGMPGGNGGSSGGGMDMFSQIFGMSSGRNISNTGEDSSLSIAKVCVSVGQQVAKGDVLYKLEEESVQELEAELQSNIEKAKADLDAVYADQKLSKLTAEYTYETSMAYGSYADTEYNTTIQELQDAVDTAEINMQRAKDSLTGYEEQLKSITASSEDAVELLENCEYGLKHTDKEDDLYLYVTRFEEREEAQANADSLEQQKEQLTQRVEQAEDNVEMTTKAYNTAKRNLEQGLLSAKETLALRKLAYETASETYDIALAYLAEDAESQENIYQETQDKWEEFSSHIDGDSVCAQYNGVITNVDLAEGDSINTGSTLVTLYNMDEVSMTVTVDEADMTAITLNSQANISFTAYPEDTFTALVTEIADAETDSGGNVTYDVTVTMQGDVSGLFQGMTGDITFVTEEIKEVLYVSRRAIVTEGDKNYVKVKDANGKIQRKEITTGFSDGVNVEVVEGLLEGDIVLIESKVSGS